MRSLDVVVGYHSNGLNKKKRKTQSHLIQPNHHFMKIMRGLAANASHMGVISDTGCQQHPQHQAPIRLPPCPGTGGQPIGSETRSWVSTPPRFF